MNAAKINIVAVTSDFSSIAKSIGGENVNVNSLINGSKNLHNVTPKTSMAFKLKKADLIIRLGMSQDSWVDGLIQVSKNPKLQKGQPGYLDASKRINKLEIPNGKIDGRVGDVHIEGNPHYWLNPNNGLTIAEEITKHLILIDPKNKQFYKNNEEKFKQDLSNHIIIWENKLKNLQKSSFISYHKVWSYFFDAFNLNSIGELERVPGIPPSAKHLNQLKNKVKNTSQKTIVITASYFPQKSGKIFAKQIESEFISLKTNVDFKEIKNYIELFDYLVAKLNK
ncbi:MAG: metal ABC transporter substrate-binding protein [Candidatus Margulisiibacteriota bacterium]